MVGNLGATSLVLLVLEDQIVVFVELVNTSATKTLGTRCIVAITVQREGATTHVGAAAALIWR